MAYYMAPALKTLQRQLNEMFPGRDKASDGWIGDTSHKARPSDHNPDWSDGGIVRAFDIDEDLVQGLTHVGEAMALVNRIIADERVAYVIYEGMIWQNPRVYSRGNWIPYSGPNAHRHHIHVSVRRDTRYDRNSAPWNLDGLFGILTGAVNVTPANPTNPTNPTKDWFDMATKDELIEAIKAAGPVEVYFFQTEDTIYEADVEKRVYRRLSSPTLVNDRKTVLTRAGVKWANWSGTVANPGAFGVAVPHDQP